MKVQWFRFRKILKKVINFFIEDLQKRAINVIALILSSLVVLNLLEKPIDSSRNKPSIVLIRYKILKKSILVLLRFLLLGVWTFPITTEHGVGFPGASLPVCKYSQVVTLRYFGEIIPEEIINIPLSLILCDGLIEFGFDNRHRVGRYLDRFTLDDNKNTSYSTSAT